MQVDLFKAVLVIVERGWQVGNLYFDPDVAAFAERFDLALLLARHCRAKTEEDMDIIPEHRIGRALLQSSRQFVRQSHHPELDQSKLILLFWRRLCLDSIFASHQLNHALSGLLRQKGTPQHTCQFETRYGRL